MMNIYKYPLELKVEQKLNINLVKVLDIQIQNNTPVLWSIVDSDIGKCEQSAIIVYCFGTGTSDVDLYKHLDLNYISSTQINGFVFHWFYR